MTAKHSAARNSPRLLIALAIVIAIIGYAAYLLNRPLPPARGVLAQQISLGASATSDFYMTGTLATLGSFDWDVAPLQTHVAVAARAVADQLLKHAITVGQAVAIQAQLVSAKNLLSKAVSTCNQDSRTGKCRGDELRARAYLSQAKRVLAGVPY
jgi:uncharacterized membrane protein (DUF4010 family)